MTFSQSSVDMVLAGNVLKAKCKDLDGVLQSSAIDLNMYSYITNHEGKLDCVLVKLVGVWEIAW